MCKHYYIRRLFYYIFCLTYWSHDWKFKREQYPSLVDYIIVIEPILLMHTYSSFSTLNKVRTERYSGSIFVHVYRKALPTNVDDQINTRSNKKKTGKTNEKVSL